ncbi:unnamed protein product [Lasius platythorax]|uniref:Uncharacterized protein n=1 Tax=Lasius platythorax TaxID=488582 RepID=A0AAV2NU88_9HYME
MIAPHHHRKSPSPRIGTEVHLGHVTARGSNYRETTPPSTSPISGTPEERISAAIHAADYFPAALCIRPA